MNRRQRLFLLFTAVACAAVVVSLSFSALVQNSEDSGIRIVATFYPLAFMAEEIGGDLVSVSTLIPPNTEVHVWEPSTADILAADSADIILYNGAGLEPWFEEDILPAIHPEKKLIVETVKGVDLLPAGADGDEGETGLYDPHTWVSPFLARLQGERIFQALCTVDPGNASLYSQHWARFSERMDSLDSNYTEILSTKNKSAIFVSHAAFGYLAQRYGFEQYGVIGLSADEEPSSSAIASLVDLMIEYDTYIVYVDPLYRQDYAVTLRNSLESEVGREVEILHLYLLLGPMDGLGFVEQMEANLQSLAIGLEAQL